MSIKKTMLGLILTFCLLIQMATLASELNGLDSLQTDGKLTIANVSRFYDDRMAAAVNSFNQIYPNVEVCFEELDESHLVSELMAEKERIDIMLITRYEIEPFRQAGILTDLSQFQLINNSMSDWNDLTNLHRGGFYGVPIMIIPVSFRISSDATFLYDEIKNEPCTWQEFVDLGEKIQGKGVAPLLSESKRFPLAVRQYLGMQSDGSDIDFDTNTFRKLAINIKRAFDIGCFVDDDSETLMSIEDVGGYLLDYEAYRTLPLVENELVVPADYYAMAINKHTNDTDMAVEFLSIYASKAVQSKVSLGVIGEGLLCDYDEYPLLIPDYVKPSKGSIHYWNTLLERSVLVYYNMDFYLFMGDQMEAYIDGEIDVETLIIRLNQKYTMIVDE